MDELILRAESRTVLGKQVRRLRREGRVPGIVYGPVVPDTIPVMVDDREFAKFFLANGHSALFKLTWDGGEETVFIREVQVDPVRRNALHVDFFAPNLREALTAMVPVVLGEANPDAVGVLTTVRTEIEVRGLPTDLPHQVDADISNLLEVGDQLRVGDLALPRGVAAVTAEDEVIAHLIFEEIVAEEEEEEAVEGVEVEGEAEGAAEPSAEAEAAPGEDGS